jgi:guanine deaminase
MKDELRFLRLNRNCLDFNRNSNSIPLSSPISDEGMMQSMSERGKKNNDDLICQKHTRTTCLTLRRFIIPGMIDTHIHAPQYPNMGTGTDVQLLEWLQRYTFPTEAKYKDEEFSKNVFKKAVER